MTGPIPGRVDVARVEELTRELLLALGETPDREGLADTPKRVARWWAEFLDYDAGKLDTAFTSQAAGQMVVVEGMRVWSLCEHHLLPFWADVTIAYVPAGKVLGLSKFARIAHKYAHRLQIQERLVKQIGESVVALTGTPDVAVVAQGEHLCMTMRGIKTPSVMTSTWLHGRFDSDPGLRQELFLVMHRRS